MAVELRLEIDWESFEKLLSDLSAEAIIKAMTMALEETSKIPLEAFQTTVETWEDQPDFQTEIFETPEGVRAEIFTTDEIYYYVSRGTRYHRIPSSGISVKPMPVGPGPYMPKTYPGRLQSVEGSRPPTTIFARSVEHPGIQPRDFPRQIYIQKKGEIVKKFKDEFIKQLRAGRRR